MRRRREFLESHLKGLGYSVELQEVEKDRFNVIATTGASPRVVFFKHMDTVPRTSFPAKMTSEFYGRRRLRCQRHNRGADYRCERLRAEGVNEIWACCSP